jgi:CubicO group peptidase (beta-lactamase class C family)
VARGHRTRPALVLAGVALLGTLGGSVSSAEFDEPATTSVDAWVTARMEEHGLPGVAVVVVQNGRTVHLRGYGTTGPSGEPVTSETPFLVGSVSKPFTAHVIRRLAADGMLSLDEPVLPYLAHLVDDPPDGFEAVTVLHLLTHTAGLRMSVGLPGTVPIHTTDDALERRVRDVLTQPLTSPPGQRYEYSNAGYGLLAAVAEQITGQRFDELLDEQILSPLRMGDTLARADHPAAARMATGHRQWFGRWRPAELPLDEAGVAYGYLGSTAEDLARFLHAHLGPEPSLVPADAAQLAREPAEPTGWDIPSKRARDSAGWSMNSPATG